MHTPERTTAGRGQSLVVVGGAILAGIIAARAMRRSRERTGVMIGRRVLITGGSRGLGFALAQECVREGARVAICARDRLELSQARTQLAGEGNQGHFALVCDVTDRSAVERMVRTVEQRLGGIDILINNAGVITLGPLETMTTHDFEYAMKVHFWGPLYAMLAALPGMKERGGGRIVNISSIGGKIGVPQLAPYCASKFALQGLSESLHAELRKEGITVTLVCPGIMRTGGHLNATYKGQPRAGYAWMNAFNLAPGMSVSAEYAARRIVAAAVRGEGEVVIGAAAKAADKVHGILPAVFMMFESLAAHLLPGSGGIGRAHATGLGSEPGVLPRWMKRPVYRTAERLNQFAGAHPQERGHDEIDPAS